MSPSAAFHQWCAHAGLIEPSRTTADDRGQPLVALASYVTATVSLCFATVTLIFDGPRDVIGVNLVMTALFALVPQLRRFGALSPVGGFYILAAASLTILCVQLGTDSGLLFYFFVIAAGSPMVLGLDHRVIQIVTIVLSMTVVSLLHFTIPADTGLAAPWLLNVGFIVNSVVAGVLGATVVAYGLFQIQQAQATIDEANRRNQMLLDNILPRDVAERLKTPSDEALADAYDDASILFADIVGFTAMSDGATPSEVVRYLDRLYSALDGLVEQHRLEKIKTTGDSYMVVSGVPVARHDHLEALAHFALEMRAVTEAVVRTDGRPTTMRIGLACGPVVAGVIGSRKFFYDVWGDAVNLASRMESTGVPGRIQVPTAVRDRLCGTFTFDERGPVEVKGKGLQHTWFLTGRASR